MTQIHEVPDDWNPDQRCCLHCGNSEPDFTLRAITHPAADRQALACTWHLAFVADILDSFAPANHPADQQVPKLSTTPTASSAHAPRHRSRA